MAVIHGGLVSPAVMLVGLPAVSAQALSALFASSYVGSIYLSNLFSSSTLSSKSLRSSQAINDPSTTVPVIASTDEAINAAELHGPRPGDRDHPATIKRRMAAVSLASVGSMITLLSVVKQVSGATLRQSLLPTLRLMGIPVALQLPKLDIQAILPHVLAPTLLLGPLIAMYIDGSLPLQDGTGNFWSRLKRQFSDWGLVEYRNYVVGPITEELVFRSCILGASLLARPALSVKALVFATPLWFGLAHAHHAWETYKKNGRNRDAAIHAIALSSFQLTYTTLFGWFASYLFLRTGSVVPPTIAHIYCNLMGIYLPTSAVSRHPRKKTLIWASYLAGVVGFAYGLARL